MFAHFMLNVVLAVLWCLLFESFTGKMFIIGYGVGAAVLYILRGMLGETIFFHKLGVGTRLVFVFIYELIVANLQVAWIILKPKLNVQPALIRLPIELETDIAITSLANMISLTPGTISVDVAEDRKSLIVHCLNVPDIEATKRGIKDAFEKPLRVLER